MRIGLVGLVVALLGAALAFTVFPQAGYWIVVVGVLLGFVGAGVHWYKIWRRAFGVPKD